MDPTKRLPNVYAVKPNGKPGVGTPGKLSALKARPDFLMTVYVLAKRGASYEDIAQALKVSEAVVKQWRANDDEFLSAYKRGKDEFDSGEVESALVKAARGYEYDETTVKSLSISQGRRADKISIPAEEVTVAHKKMAPSVGAIVFYLTNRQRERWQNTKYVKHDGKVDGPPAIQNNYQLVVDDLKELPQEDLENFARTLQAAAERKRSQAESEPGRSGTA